ncbi:MAG: disulfide bond formation protein B [Pseudomonadota bacterium]
MKSFFFKTNELYFLTFLACVFLLCCAYYFEYVMGLAPCPLCITQRFFTLLVGITALIAALHQPANFLNKVYPFKIVLFSCAGAFFAGRMVWLQSLPEGQAPACGPSLEYILTSFPFMDAMTVLLKGNGDCAKVTWQFLNLSMPAWVLIAFIVFAVIGLAQLSRPKALPLTHTP